MNHLLRFFVFCSCLPLALPVLAFDKPGMLKWKEPTHRENGEPMPRSEIGGYVIVGRDTSGIPLHTVEITTNTLTEYRFSATEFAGVAHFFIAVYDTDGLYSLFIEIHPTAISNRLPPPRRVELN